MALKFVTFDVFTQKKFYGNPLAIVHIPASVDLTQSQKQLIAREFNLSETVLLYEPTDEDRRHSDVRIGIFTPWAEINFAGHPTVGTSNYLLYHLQNDPTYSGVKALQARAGRIPIQAASDGHGIQLQVAHNVHIHDNPFSDTTFSQYPVVSIVKGMTFILPATSSLNELAKPTENLLGADNGYDVYDKLDEGYREGLVGSYFYHNLGFENDVRRLRTRMLSRREDPATGSAASALCAYLTLSEEGLLTRKYHITQGVEMGRRSDIFITVTLEEGGKAVKEVLLSGTAVKIMEGTLNIPSADADD